MLKGLSGFRVRFRGFATKLQGQQLPADKHGEQAVAPGSTSNRGGQGKASAAT